MPATVVFGVQVAQLANFPKHVVDYAARKAKEYEVLELAGQATVASIRKHEDSQEEISSAKKPKFALCKNEEDSESATEPLVRKILDGARHSQEALTAALVAVRQELMSSDDLYLIKLREAML